MNVQVPRKQIKQHVHSSIKINHLVMKIRTICLLDTESVIMTLIQAMIIGMMTKATQNKKIILINYHFHPL